MVASGITTWISFNVIQITCVMRADIKVGSFVKLPQTRAIITATSFSAYSQERQDLIFQGTFMITQVHHVGNYKSPDALAWVTVFDATLQPAGSVPTTDSPSSPLLGPSNSNNNLNPGA